MNRDTIVEKLMNACAILSVLVLTIFCFTYLPSSAKPADKKAAGTAEGAPSEETPSEDKAEGTDAPVIFIDPCHGGADSGTVANGTKEADINLALARQIRDILLSRGYDARLTREDEIIVPEEDSRLERARRENASFYLFLRCNGDIHSRISSGATVEYSSGASTVSGPGDNASRQAAGSILKELKKNPGIKLSPDEITSSALIPSGASPVCVSVKAGYLTNRSDAEMLGDKEYLMALAEAIASGVCDQMASSMALDN
ncbi:MAG: N-acetylmuramoyl-L-alanine amidase [Lachnospiraceae bacterium]|nr:N-acetylmuramoyl-L-alanine amidase [Lachnospiraceae bacterium]